MPVDKVTRDSLIEHMERLIGEGDGRVLAPVNIDIINKAVEDRSLFDFLNDADVVYADGSGVVVGSWLAGDAIPPRVTSIALLWELARRWNDGRHSLYFLGGPGGVAEAARDQLQAQHSGLKVVGCHRGHLTTPELQDAALRDIERTKPDVLCVGFGTPIQEQFIARHRERLRSVPLVWSVGALTSHIAGLHRRAPAVMRSNGLEWAWRLILEPKRMWRRYLVGNPVFLGRVVKDRVLGG